MARATCCPCHPDASNDGNDHVVGILGNDVLVVREDQVDVAVDGLDGVSPGAAEEHVLAPAAVEVVVSILAEQVVCAILTEQPVVSGAAKEPVVAEAAVELVVAGLAEEVIRAGAAVEPIVAVAAWFFGPSALLVTAAATAAPATASARARCLRRRGLAKRNRAPLPIGTPIQPTAVRPAKNIASQKYRSAMKAMMAITTSTR